ncbi:MAG: heparinase II/III family protein [Gemmatimonadaceae bacterium]
MLLLDDARMPARKAAVRGPLRPLYESLTAELAPLLDREPYIPTAKALLTRAGGRCEQDGAALEFDPASPHAHRCPACGTVHRAEVHHRAWVTHYQLWLAERAVQAALFHLLGGDERHAALARDILGRYAERYVHYPNRDNVLGPTRLFFSTYMESVWLLQICVAADLMRAGGDHATAELVRDRIAEPSAMLIAAFDEGASNRQVWNNAARLAAAGLCGDEPAADRILTSPSGVEAHLQRALLPDGTWYEGENYHQFALRGLWYAVTMCDARGVALGRESIARFERAFRAPYVTALPDFTLPARKDSQYAVSLRQWRYAELAELGFARTQDPVVGAALGRTYEPGTESRDTGRSRSTADVERNGPACALTRADLGWRALLHALPELPPLVAARPASALLEGQGLAVFRRGDAYVALDYGQSGGGHGHPDRLNLLLAEGSTRWLDDLGTGSYLEPSLHWYRSTLAHNAPIVDGRSQPPLEGTLVAHDEQDAWGWIEARADLPDGVVVTRTLVVAPDHLVDELTWTAPRAVRVELPWHLDAGADARDFVRAPLDGGEGPEDGFAFARDAMRASIPAGTIIRLAGRRDGRQLQAAMLADCAALLYRAMGPGQPAADLRPFYLWRVESERGSMRSVLAWGGGGEIPNVNFEQNSTTVELAGARHAHSRDATGWRVTSDASGLRRTVRLGGRRPARPPMPAQGGEATSPPTVLRRAGVPGGWYSELSGERRAALLAYDLSEHHYRRSEDTWGEAGAPRATIALAADDRALAIFLVAHAGDPRFAASNAVNARDNEHPDTMAAGVQLYLRDAVATRAWMLIPQADDSAVRIRPIGADTQTNVQARWRALGDGYEMRIDVPLEASNDREYSVDLDVVVNETTHDRERRRGQLVLSGGRGEFVYLRGDRHDMARLIPLVLVR